MSVLGIMNEQRNAGAKAVLDSLTMVLTRSLDDMQQWAEDLNDRAVDGLIPLDDVQKEVEALMVRMHGLVSDARDKLST